MAKIWRAPRRLLLGFTVVEGFAGLDRTVVLGALGILPAGAPSPPADPVVAAVVELRPATGRA